MNRLDTLFILCGGKGTRFQEISTTEPKILAQIKSRPFIDILISQSISAGYKRMIFLLGHLSDPIVNFLYNSKFKKNIIIEYVIESTPLGTGGALYHALKIYQDINRFSVLNGDTYWLDGLPIDSNQGEDCISLFNPEYTQDYGGIKVLNSRAVEFHVNPMPGDYASAGMLCTTRDLILKNLPMQGSMERKFLPLWIEKYSPTCKFVTNTIDFGVADRYRNLNGYK